MVTSFALRLHPVQQVLAGVLTYPASKARAAIVAYRELAREAPDELSTALSLSRPGGGELAVSIAVCDR